MTKKQLKENANKGAQFAYGVFELTVVASIGFMSYVVWTGLDDPISKALTVPALGWAVLRLVAKFTK